MRICFYANMGRHKNWREVFDKVEFYRVDIRLLRELGHDVVLSGGPSSLDHRADIYYCWWWGHAVVPLMVGKTRRKPVLVTGAFDYSTCREEIPGLCYLDRPLWQKLLLRGALRFADRNLFISSHEYDEVTKNLFVRNPVAAPLAIDTDFYCPSSPPGSVDNYFFTVSWLSKTNAVRKGLTNSIMAFAEFARDVPETRFLVAGMPGNAEADLRALVDAHGLNDRVRFLGLISDEEKRTYYRRCLAYVQPTLYEGFGHAIGEAVACGTRVVTAPAGAVPEVAGAHAVFVDPKSIASIAEGMRNVVAKPRTDGEPLLRHRWISDNFSLANRRETLRRVLESVSGPSS